MKKSDLTKILIISAAVAAAAAGGAAAYYCYRKNKEQKELDREAAAAANAYILGGGMSALASALYLVRDCGVKAENIHIFTKGAVDHGNETTGYICRRGKILDDKKSANFFDLISDVRSLDIPDLTVCDEILNIYNARGITRPITLVDESGDVINIAKIRLDKELKNDLLKLLREDTANLAAAPIYAVMPAAFFDTQFWALISAAYGLAESSSAKSLADALSHIDETLSGTMPSDFDRQEEIIEPLKAHLKGLGVDIEENSSVSDIDFENGRADAIHYTSNGVRKTVYLNAYDICILPTDEIAEAEALGSFDKSAPKEFSEPYALWERLASKSSAFKDPSALFEDNDENMSEEFTITLSNRLLPELIDSVTSGALGTDGVIVLDNSSWKLTICAVPPSHFKNQSNDTAIIWGTATNFTADGEKTGKAMTDCSGAEILYELIHCLNLGEAWEEIRETVINVIPCHRRFDKAYLSPEAPKLEIIPTGISNFAVSGEFTDGSGSVFTEEFAVTTARRAAYRLMKSGKKIYRVSEKSPGGIIRTLKKLF